MFRIKLPSAVLLSLPLLGGCDSVSRLSDFDPRSPSISTSSQPASISPTPTPAVTAQELPPPPPRFSPSSPTAPGTTTPVIASPDGSLPPPGSPGQLPGGVAAPAAGDLSPPPQPKIAAATRKVEPVAPQPAAPEKPSQSRLTGGWSVAQGSGSKCKLTLSNTPALDLYKAQTSGCGTGLTKINAWELRGDEIYLYEQGGAVAARLKQAGNTSFNGAVAKSGAPISINK
ncbi:MAG: AprI/Inh family metalloprotease inhibitor [Beijerinckiaceae bacterium]|nr:AprI/Inh family metalloprotease inhibitor [Beijerinckiaceae bacterium]